MHGMKFLLSSSSLATWPNVPSTHLISFSFPNLVMYRYLIHLLQQSNFNLLKTFDRCTFIEWTLMSYDTSLSLLFLLFAESVIQTQLVFRRTSIPRTLLSKSTNPTVMFRYASFLLKMTKVGLTDHGLYCCPLVWVQSGPFIPYYSNLLQSLQHTIRCFPVLCSFVS